MLAACGAPRTATVSRGPEAEVPAAEVQPAPAEPVVTVGAQSVEPEPEPECVVGAQVELARGTFSYMSSWTAARGRSGFAIAHCADEQHVAVRAFDDALAPFGEAQRLDARHAYVGTRTGAVFRVPSRLAGPLASDARLEVRGAVVDLQLVGVRTSSSVARFASSTVATSRSRTRACRPTASAR